MPRRSAVPTTALSVTAAALALLTGCSGEDPAASPTFTAVETTPDNTGGDTGGGDHTGPQPSATSDTGAADAVSGTTTVTPQSDADALSSVPGTDRPASLTGGGWSGSSVRCNTGDPWVYAAEGAPGQVVICLDDDVLYAVDTDNPYGGDDAYAATSAVCPVSGTGRDRYVWHHADTGWTEYDGTTRYVMDIFSGRGRPDLTDAANIVEDAYDGAWTNPDVTAPTLKWCRNAGDSPTTRLLAG